MQLYPQNPTISCPGNMKSQDPQYLQGIKDYP